MARAWKKPFLKALRNSGNVRVACHMTDIERSTAYRARRRDGAFAASWAEAIEEATDALEAEVRRRALSGVEEPVFYRGKQIAIVRKPSDQLLMFLLRGLRPNKYGAGREDGPQTKPAIVELVERLRREDGGKP